MLAELAVTLLLGTVPGATGLSLEEAVRLASERNPEVRSAAAAVEAEQAALDSARSLLASNPEVEAEVGPRLGTAERGLEAEVTLLQPLEIGGQRGARIDAAAGALAAARARLAALRSVLAAEVREAFGRALAARERLGLAAEIAALAEDGLRAADDRLRAGRAARIELNAARSELGRAVRAAAQAEQEHQRALADVRLLIGADAPTLVPAGELAPLARRAVDPGADPLGRALAARADLAASRDALRAARAEAELARRQRIPDLQLGAKYSRGEDAHVVQGVVGFPLPLFDRNGAERGAAAARVTQAAAELSAAERRVREEVALALSRRAAARATIEAFDGGLLAAAEENTALASEGHAAGKLGLVELIVLRREALAERLAYLDALEELNAAEAALARALGAE